MINCFQLLLSNSTCAATSWHQIFTLEYLFHHLLKDGGKASQLVPVIFLVLFSSFDPP